MELNTPNHLYSMSHAEPTPSTQLSSNPHPLAHTHQQHHQRPTLALDPHRHSRPSLTPSESARLPHPHLHLHHEKSQLSVNVPRNQQNEDEDEAIARKKKNADAQAAFRFRRQTYIKSLEDTVTELKRAVTEMEVIVKTASHEIKIQRQQIDYLQNKLMSYESGELRPPRCTCSKIRPSAPPGTGNPSADKLDSAGSPSVPFQFSPDTLASSASSALLSLSGTFDGPPQPNSLPPTTKPSSDATSRDWSGLQTHTSHPFPNPHQRPLAQPSVRRMDPHPPSSTQHHDPVPMSRPSNCDVGFFASFDTAHGTQVFDGSYRSLPTAQSTPNLPGVPLAPSGVASSTDAGTHPRPTSGLHPVMPQSSLEHAPVNRPAPLSVDYPQPSNSYPHTSSEGSHHLSVPSPRGSSCCHTRPIPVGSYSDGHALQESEDSSSKSGLPRPDGSSIPENSQSSTRPPQLSDRSPLRPSLFISPLETRSGFHTPDFPSSLPSGDLNSSSVEPSTSGGESLKGYRTSFSCPKRRKIWVDDGFDPERSGDISGSRTSPPALLGPATPNKLIGLPAKVARCEQAVLEVSKVLSQAKEKVHAATRINGNDLSSTVSASNGLSHASPHADCPQNSSGSIIQNTTFVAAIHESSRHLQNQYQKLRVNNQSGNVFTLGPPPAPRTSSNVYFKEYADPSSSNIRHVLAPGESSDVTFRYHAPARHDHATVLSLASQQS